jgi:hypothetical protein
MSGVTFIWALILGACVTMALPHLLVSVKRRAWENLLFALAALAVAGIALGELAIMHAPTRGDWSRANEPRADLVHASGGERHLRPRSPLEAAAKPVVPRDAT